MYGEKLMRDRSNRYIIAAKRGMRDKMPSKWIEQLKSIDELFFIGDPGSYRVMVEASPKAIKLVRNLFGDYCHIELLIQHKPL